MLLGDNSAMMDIIKKDGTTQRSRYFERATMLVKYAVLRLIMETALVPTAEMIADIFTKAVDKDTFIKMRRHLLNIGGDTAYATARAQMARALQVMQDMSYLL